MKTLKAFGAALGTWLVVLWAGLGVAAIAFGGVENLKDSWSRWLAYGALVPALWVFVRVKDA